MIVWSVALAAVLLLAAWGAANWRVFHLAYCRHLLRSGNQEEIAKALRLMPKHGHIHVGMSYQEVCDLLRPLEPMEMRAKTTGRLTADGQVFPGRFLGPVRNPDRVSQINPPSDPPLAPGQIGYVDVYSPPVTSSLAKCGSWTMLYIEFRDDRVFSIQTREPV